MTGLKLVGLGAAFLAIPLAAEAAPYVRQGTAVYPTLTAPVAAPPVVEAAAPPSETPKLLPRRGRHARRGVAMAAGAPVETKVAPSPADLRAKPEEPQAKDGPHESPAPTMADLVSKHARDNGVPEKLANAVVTIESRYNPAARGGGALGLMQIKVQTARSVGFGGDWHGLMTPDTNLHFGMKVLADAYRSSKGDVCLTLAKYQSGHLTTRVSAANRAYCARARAIMAKL